MDTIRVLAFGDFVATNSSKVRLSEELQNKINGADIKVVNFEAPISGIGNALPKSGPSLAQSPKSPETLEQIGFNVALMANNHIMDYGPEACLASVDAFKTATVVGAGRAKEAYTCKILEIKGKKIGLLAFCQYEFGIVEGKDDGEHIGVTWIHSLDIPEILRAARTQCNYVLVFPHAGLEDVDAPLPIWRDCYKKMIEWGADAIIASHPHVPQGWEEYQKKPIFYSLGNFYFDVLSGNDYWNKGLAVELILDESVKFNVYNIEFKTDGAICFDKSAEIACHNEELQLLIKDENKYYSFIDKACMERYPVYSYEILRGLGGVAWSNLSLKMKIRLMVLMIINNKDKQTLLNILRCETHRWVCERCLILLNKKNGK